MGAIHFIADLSFLLAHKVELTGAARLYRAASSD